MERTVFLVLLVILAVITSPTISASASPTAELERIRDDERILNEHGAGNKVTLPFGHNLFKSGFDTERFNGLNENYLVAIGDKISIWLWGAVSFSDVVTVDNQGNIFIPDIGPIRIAGEPASRINEVVSSHISSIYTSNVNVYVNLLSSTPVSVFVTGPVERPGQYAGLASDSVLYYLKRAGGIEPRTGSYRHVTILRGGVEIQSFDLYDFVKEGQLPNFVFEDRDTILVKPQGATVTVNGDVRYENNFELNGDDLLGEQLIRYSRPDSSVSHVGLSGTRSNGPIYLYLPLNEFLSYSLADGDIITFNTDLRTQVIDIGISGSYLGPSFYAVNSGTRLHDLLDKIEVDKDQTDVTSIYIKRASVAQRQKEQIEESLQRLERATFTAPAGSDGEAIIRAKEAELITLFVDRARAIEPLGRVIVSSNGKVANVRLEQGDEIVIPAKSDLVQVAGEVLMPQAIVHNPNATINDYIAWSGGFTERADYSRVGVVKANGEVSFVPDQRIEAGDQVLVLPRVDNKTMQVVKDITQIIYQIAVAANVVLD
nr:polysaccharide biosynthesis/export family protein [Aliagarivorans marinus]